MKKEELIELKKGYEELAKHYRLQANLKISEESRETSLRLAKRYEELNKIISREIPIVPNAEDLGRETLYTCPVCAEKFCATDSEVVNYCWNCGQRLTERKERRNKYDGNVYKNLH